MPKIQIGKHATEDGANWLKGFFPDGTSPCWVSKEEATDFPNSDQIIEQLKRDGYGFYEPAVEYVKTTLDEDRENIIQDMKAGRISKADGVRLLRAVKALESGKSA